MELTKNQTFGEVYETVYTMFDKKFSTWWIQWSSTACGYNAIKWKRNLPKFNVQTINVINRFKTSEKRIRSICIDIYRSYKDDNIDNLFECLTTLKIKQFNIKFEKVEKYRKRTRIFDKNIILEQQDMIA